MAFIFWITLFFLLAGLAAVDLWLLAKPIRNWYLMLGQKPHFIAAGPQGLCRKICVAYRMNQPDACEKCEVIKWYLETALRLPDKPV